MDFKPVIKKNIKTYTCMPAGAGDILCLISVAHTLARTTGDKISIYGCQDIVEAYNDGILSYGQNGEVINIFNDIWNLHRSQDGACKHYLHTFYKLLMPNSDLYDHFEFPNFPEEPKRCLIQPWSVAAQNPSDEYIQNIIDTFQNVTGKELFCIGKQNTDRRLKNLNYSLLEDGLTKMMGHIQNAEIVLTPRSFSANCAAGYNTKCFLWMPNDSENWQLNFPNWNVKKVFHENGIYKAINELKGWI